MQQSRVIYKYEIGFGRDVDMPCTARILSAGVQGGSIFIWASVDLSKPMVTRKLKVFSTGEHFDDKGQYGFIGTVTDNGFVFHVFEDLS